MKGFRTPGEPEHFSKYRICGSKVWREFCEETSLHGLKFVAKKNIHLVIRLLWTIALAAALSAALYFIHSVYRKWQDNPVIISTATSSMDIKSIPFPAVTICPPHLVSKRLADRLLNEMGPKQEMSAKVLKEFCETGELTEELLNTAGDIQMSCDDIWRNSKIMVNVEQFHNLGFRIQYQPRRFMYNTSVCYAIPPNCCTFNSVKPKHFYRNLSDELLLNLFNDLNASDWNIEKGFRAEHEDIDLPFRASDLPFRASGSGHLNALTIDIAEPVYCKAPRGGEYKIALHDPAESPNILFRVLDLRLDANYHIKVKPEVIEASSSLRSMYPHRRKCYFPTERPLRFYRTYTEWNCRLECLANNTLVKCGCLLDFIPKIEGVPICTPADTLYCYFNQSRGFNRKKCDCLQACEELIYQTTEQYRPLDKVSEDVYESQINIYFSEPRFIPLYRSELIGLSEFLGNTGGLLGLFIGFSVISIVEIFYFGCLGFWRICRSR